MMSEFSCGFGGVKYTLAVADFPADIINPSEKSVVGLVAPITAPDPPGGFDFVITRSDPPVGINISSLQIEIQ
jgi:hypothetical protein